jgi:hypothetical protein
MWGDIVGKGIEYIRLELWLGYWEVGCKEVRMFLKE